MKNYNINKDGENREIILSDYITNTSVSDIINKISGINFIDKEREEEFIGYTREPIKLIINSFGGSVYDGLSLYDYIANSKTPIHTISSGSSMSMGFIILLAGHKRYATKHSTIMYHEVSTFCWDKLEGIKREVEELKRLQDDILDTIVLERTKILKEKLIEVRNFKKDWFICPQDALKLGIIDEII